MKLQFKTKPVQGQILPSTDVIMVVDAPKQWKRSHVVYAGRVDSFINSNMLHGAIERELRRAKLPKRFSVDNPPDCVTIEPIGPLVTVTVTLD